MAGVLRIELRYVGSKPTALAIELYPYFIFIYYHIYINMSIKTSLKDYSPFVDDNGAVCENRTHNFNLEG